MTENFKGVALICSPCLAVGQGTSSRWNQYKTKVPGIDEPAECRINIPQRGRLGLAPREDNHSEKYKVGQEHALHPFWRMSQKLIGIPLTTTTPPVRRVHCNPFKAGFGFWLINN